MPVSSVSDVVRVSITQIPEAANPHIDLQPKSTISSVGQSEMLIVVASSLDGGSLSYQWFTNSEDSTISGTPIAGENNSFIAPTTTFPGITYYYVVITNKWVSGGSTNLASTVSEVVSVTVCAIIDAIEPAIISQPQSAVISMDSNYLLSVEAISQDDGILCYQWYRNSSNTILNGEPIVGAVGSTYIPTTSAPGYMYYYVVITNINLKASGERTISLTSAVASVFVKGSIPVSICTRIR